ncbi:MAG: T9SS type A sorting domain-containing protein [Candidatus Kapabacteria bacterium]|nr:T9SS type A sorting domain-containing protein [Candidatus Kapabacteria bacterium]
MKLLIIIFLLFIARIATYASEWKYTKNLDTGQINPLVCFDGMCVSVVQQTGLIELYHSYDAGDTWSLTYKADPMNEEPKYLLNIRDFSAPDKDNYFAIFSEGKYVTKSTDRGKSFSKILIAEDSNPINIFMFDSLRGIITDTQWSDDTFHHYIYITEDGWETYTIADTMLIRSEIYCIDKVNEETLGFYVLAKTGDNFSKQYVNFNIKTQNWVRLCDFKVDSTYLGFRELDIVNDSIAFLVGSELLGIAHYRSDVIYRTRDRGKNWVAVLDTIVEPKFGLQSIKFYDELNGVAVGQYGKIVMTNDGGNTWNYHPLPQQMIDEAPLTMRIDWAGKKPVVGTWYGNIYKYEGMFFKFQPIPASIRLTTPVHGSQQKSDEINFEWEPSSQLDSYHFQIAEDNNFQNIFYQGNLKSNQLTLNDFKYLTSYFWRVGLRHNKKMIWSPTWNFTTLNNVSVSESNSVSFIHPNPASEYIEINAAINPTVNRGVDETAEIKIYNTLGECVNLTRLPSTGSGSGNLRIDISHLSRGVYYIRISSRTQMFVKM